MSTYSVHPDTIDEVQSEIQNWAGASRAKGKSQPFTFARSPQKSTLRVFISHASNDLKFEIKGRSLLFQLKERRLNLNLDKFQIRTAYRYKNFCLDIDRDPALEYSFLTSTLRQFTTTKYPAFYTRVLRAVKSFEEDLTNDRIDEATAAPTDHLVMLEALSSAPWVAELVSDDSLVAAKLRGLELRQQMLETSGGALTSQQVSNVLGISRQAVDKRRSSNQLLALTQGRRGYRYPSFQFNEGKTIQGLEEVLEALKALDPWMQLNFFTSAHERLGGKTPIKALHDGLLEEVKSVASVYGEQGAL
ncbi:MAG: hypothetical protein WAL71_02245 [Terriglobales bacterium]